MNCCSSFGDDRHPWYVQSFRRLRNGFRRTRWRSKFLLDRTGGLNFRRSGDAGRTERQKMVARSQNQSFLAAGMVHPNFINHSGGGAALKNRTEFIVRQRCRGWIVPIPHIPDNDRSTGITVFKRDQNFVADFRQSHGGGSPTGSDLSHTYPTGIPMGMVPDCWVAPGKPDTDPAKFIDILGLSLRSNHDGR